jgi:hypothetical protein
MEWRQQLRITRESDAKCVKFTQLESPPNQGRGCELKGSNLSGGESPRLSRPG